jgi:hypothetical protein
LALADCGLEDSPFPSVSSYGIEAPTTVAARVKAQADFSAVLRAARFDQPALSHARLHGKFARLHRHHAALERCA